MERNHTIITVTGGLVLVLAAISCASQNSARTMSNSPPRDRVATSDRTATSEIPAPTNRTGAGDNPYDSARVVGCADQKGDQTASMDCGPQNRRMDGTGSERSGYDCASRTDARGNVIYDDPTCPSRYGQPQTAKNVYLTKESAFFDRYIEKAVKHAREAEIAGNQGHAPEMLDHAQLALDQAKQAQRAGNVPGLNEGIIELRAALSYPQSADRTAAGNESRNSRMDENSAGNARSSYDSSVGARPGCTSRTDANGTVIYDDPACSARYSHPRTDSLQEATAHVRDARIRLSEAGGMRPIDTRAPGTLVRNTSAMAGVPARTVKGELIGDEGASASTRFDGGKHYLVRDRNGNDTPISLTQGMSQTVAAGDRVEVQVDSEGRVLGISKDR